jgi:hypothetical protein
MMHVRGAHIAVALVVMALGTPSRPLRAAADDVPALTPERMAHFLETAKVIAAKDLSKGVTKPRKLTLSDGALTHDAVFQSIDDSNHIQRFSDGRIEPNFRDSYHFNIAAYRLAVVLGLDHMVPVTVERTYENRKGSLAWWIDWQWDDKTREEAKVKPPDGVDWNKQQNRMRVFSELVHDTDRNQGNQLITADWKLWMVDFTRAFRLSHSLRRPENVQRCSRDLLTRLQALTERQVAEATRPHLRPGEVKAVIKRRDRIVARITELVKQRGEDIVLY